MGCSKLNFDDCLIGNLRRAGFGGLLRMHRCNRVTQVQLIFANDADIVALLHCLEECRLPTLKISCLEESTVSWLWNAVRRVPSTPGWTHLQKGVYLEMLFLI